MSAAREERKENLLGFLRTIQKAGRPIGSFSEEERLVASGLIDSLAILQIVTYLETTYDIDFAMRGVDPEQLGSIGGILDVIEQEKK
jgi:acyl carrier protein